VTAASVTCNGGSPVVAGAILAAHDAAATALAAAQSAAAAGGSGFASWFGSANVGSESRVSAVFGQAAAFLAQSEFSYDLDAGFSQLLVPDVYVLFTAPVDNTVDGTAWSFLWNLLALDPITTAEVVAASVAHQAVVGCGAGVQDLAGVVDAPAAMLVAEADPREAARSALSYRCYLQQFVPPPSSDPG
jgi:hypothetical protein